MYNIVCCSKGGNYVNNVSRAKGNNYACFVCCADPGHSVRVLSDASNPEGGNHGVVILPRTHSSLYHHHHRIMFSHLASQHFSRSGV
jgi:hypothetical protein